MECGNKLTREDHEEVALAGIILLVGVTAAPAWGGARALAARQFRSTLDQAKQEIAAGQYGRAQKRLIELGRRQNDGRRSRLPARHLRALPRSPRSGGGRLETRSH